MSLKTADCELAEERVGAFARSLAKQQLVGVTPENVTLGAVFTLYRRHRLPKLSGQHARSVGTRLALFEEARRADLPMDDFCQTHVDAYTEARKAGTLSSLEGRTGRGARKPRPVRMGAIEVELRPVASHQRYAATQEHADAVDPAGRLRRILALARFTGRRESAICGLQASDLLLSEERIRAALAAAGLNEATRGPDGAQLYPCGAIRWSSELDKQKLVHITPITEARAELDRYLRRSPRVGDVTLFPAAEDRSKPIRRDVAARWLVKAEKAAELPKLRGGVLHPYRQLGGSERQHLSDVAVAAAGGWSDTQSL